MSEIQGRIYKSVSSVGIGELYFEIGRKTNRGSGGFSFKFVPRHVYALNEVAILATQWIQENPLAADGVFPQPKKEADNLNTDSKTV